MRERIQKPPDSSWAEVGLTIEALKPYNRSSSPQNWSRESSAISPRRNSTSFLQSVSHARRHTPPKPTPPQPAGSSLSHQVSIPSHGPGWNVSYRERERIRRRWFLSSFLYKRGWACQTFEVCTSHAISLGSVYIHYDPSYVCHSSAPIQYGEWVKRHQSSDFLKSQCTFNEECILLWDRLQFKFMNLRDIFFFCLFKWVLSMSHNSTWLACKTW